MATTNVGAEGQTLVHDYSNVLKANLLDLRRKMEDYRLMMREHHTLMEELSKLVEDLTCNTDYVITDEEEEDWKAMIHSLNHLMVDQFDKIKQFLSVKKDGTETNEFKNTNNLVEGNTNSEEFHRD